MNKAPETIDIPFSGTPQVAADILQAQFSHLEAGELRSALEKNFSDVWTHDELEQAFTVHEHAAPYARVTRNADNQTGTVMFTDKPRFYFSFLAEGDSHGRPAGV